MTRLETLKAEYLQSLGLTETPNPTSLQVEMRLQALATERAILLEQDPTSPLIAKYERESEEMEKILENDATDNSPGAFSAWENFQNGFSDFVKSKTQETT